MTKRWLVICCFELMAPFNRKNEIVNLLVSLFYFSLLPLNKEVVHLCTIVPCASSKYKMKHILLSRLDSTKYLPTLPILVGQF